MVEVFFKKNPIQLNGIVWYLQESNQGHTDFQSVALPTELRYLLSASKIDSILLFPKLFYKNAFVNLSI